MSAALGIFMVLALICGVAAILPPRDPERMGQRSLVIVVAGVFFIILWMLGGDS